MQPVRSRAMTDVVLYLTRWWRADEPTRREAARQCAAALGPEWEMLSLGCPGRRTLACPPCDGRGLLRVSEERCPLCRATGKTEGPFGVPTATFLHRPTRLAMALVPGHPPVGPLLVARSPAPTPDGMRIPTAAEEAYLRGFIDFAGDHLFGVSDSFRPVVDVPVRPPAPSVRDFAPLCSEAAWSAASHTERAAAAVALARVMRDMELVALLPTPRLETCIKCRGAGRVVECIPGEAWLHYEKADEFAESKCDLCRGVGTFLHSLREVAAVFVHRATGAGFVPLPGMPPALIAREPGNVDPPPAGFRAATEEELQRAGFAGAGPRLVRPVAEAGP